MRFLSGRLVVPMLVGLPVVCACAAPSSKRESLERVAKEWCMTIRASQVLPVYPLTEDLQPGDVFVVQTPLSQQQEEYETKGFLALDQLVTRLPVEPQGVPQDDKAANAAAVTRNGRLPFANFYREGYFKAAFAESAKRPLKPEDPVDMPRAAFPSYNFSYQAGAGLQLAIPISGVPVGLGLLGAERATGSVSISDAYTYGIDIESLYRSLMAWWRNDPEIRKTLSSIARTASGEVYLRAVNRVYLTRGVTVSLQDASSFSAGADVGAAKQVALPDLSDSDPAKVKESAAAYREALAALSGPLNAATPGGSFRFTQASQSAVTLGETFDRPLVIGYLGFDVRVEKDGQLSPPIPSFSVLNASAKGFPSVEQLENLFEQVDRMGAEGDAVFTRAANLLGGEFKATFEESIKDRGTRGAFVKAKNDYLNVDTQFEADARNTTINEALRQALESE